MSTYATLITAVRSTIQAPAASDAFFSDNVDLFGPMVDATQDLWRAIKDLKEDHFLTVDETNMSIAASTLVVAGVPADLFEIRTIEPRDLTTQPILFVPKDWKDDDFRAARALTAQDPNMGCVIYYQVTGAGPSVGTATIRVAPKLSSALLLTVGFIAGIASNLTTASTVPIPGADAALKAYAMAFALAKDREGNQPDPAWLKVYDTEKQHILEAVSPRQTQELEYAEGVFEDSWGEN